MKRIILTLILLPLWTACAPAPALPPDAPVNNSTPTDGFPIDVQPADDAGGVRDAVFIDSIEMVTMESFPPQFSLLVKGNLSTPCHQLRVQVSAPDVENKIQVDIYSIANPKAICAQMLQPFEQTIPLGSFPAGHYTVWVNGQQVTEFDA